MKDRLTFFDKRLLKMVENLTQQECKPIREKTFYHIKIDCTGKEEKWVIAVRDAVKGILADRCKNIDIRDNQMQVFISYSSKKKGGI